MGRTDQKRNSGRLRQRLAAVARNLCLPCGWIRHAAPIRSDPAPTCRFVFVSLPSRLTSIRVMICQNQMLEGMRIVSACMAGWLVIAGPAVAASPQIDYARVVKARTSMVQGKWARYVETSDSPCFTIQLFKTASLDSLSREKEICSLGKQKFSSDFAYVGVESVEFKRDHVHLEIDFTLLRIPGRNVRDCSIAIRRGHIGDLVC